MALQDEYIRTALRLPQELHTQLHAAADAAGRSFNAELIDRLAGSFDDSSQAAELAVLRETVRSQQKTSELLGAASTMLAGMLRRVAGWLPADLRKKHPEVELFEQCASATIHMDGARLVESLREIGIEPVPAAQLRRKKS